jgi:hypothetical protein
MARRNRQIARRNSRRQKLISSAVAAVVLLTLGGVYVLRSADTPVPTQGEPPVVVPSIGPTEDLTLGQSLVDEPVADDSNSQLMTVYVDGWTMKVLNGTTVKAQVQGSNREAELDFVPLNAEAIRKVATEHTDVLTDVMSRFVTGDRRVTCSNGVCGAGPNTFEPGLLAEAGEIPAFGKMYEDWGISRGLWAAKVRVPLGGQIVNFIADDYAGTTVVAGPVTGEGGEATVVPQPDSGWGKNAYYIAASFGRLHLVMPGWRDTTFGANDAIRMIGRPADSFDAAERRDLVAIAGRDPLSRGVGDRDAAGAALGLNDYQLTYYSSPTTGCGAAALCIPAVLDVKRENVIVVDKVACSADGTAVIVSVRSRWSVNLPGATHLAGVWGAGVDPTTLPGAAGMLSVLGYKGAPPLVDGKITFENLTFYAIDALGLALVAGGRAENANALPAIDASKFEQLFDGTFTSCTK